MPTQFQKIDYLYNIRGWLTAINNPENLGTDLFAMRLNYNTPENNLSNATLYSGNINSIVWANKQTTGSTLYAGYAYSYDKLNRLTNAHYASGSNFTQNAGAYNENYNYDKNGNID